MRCARFLPLLLLLVACGSTSPEAPPVGRYVATRFVVTPPAEAAADLLAGGALFDVSIMPDRATSGRFFVPAALADGTAIDESLTGLAFLDEAGRLQFVFRPADLVVESLRFRPDGVAFVADTLTTDGTRVALTLTRQP